MSLKCSGCPSSITAKAKTGKCRSCAAKANMADPAFRARLEAQLRIAKASPEHRANASAASRRTHDARQDDPTWQAYKIASGQRLRRQYDASADAQAANLAQRGRAGAVHTDRVLAWCPADRRTEYRRLRRMLGADEARRVIESDTPGTEEHARRVVANHHVAQRIRHERDRAQSY